MRKSEDRPLDDIANFRLLKNGQEPTHVTSVRIDVGWTVLASAGVEKVDMDTNILLTDDKGAVVGEVNFNNKEEKGIKLLGDERSVDATSDDKKPAKFPVHEQVVVTLTEVDPKVKNIVIFVTNYSGTGFTQLESVRCRFVETATGQDLSVFSVDCRQGEASGKKTVMVGKVYRDNICSAFHDWKFAQTQDSELSLEAVQKMQAQRGLPAFDEDAGLSIPDWEQKAEIQWRIRGLGQFCYGETIAEATPAAVAVAVYDGRRDGDGLRHDRRARCCYPNGDSYYGQYTHGKRDGMGIYMFRYGSAYHGIFKEGHLQEGTMEHPDGGKYVGQYMKDKMEGEGTYIYPGGDKYSGHWVSGKKEGHGRYEYSNGTVLEGDWKNGQPDGNLKYDESTTYKAAGKFDKGVPLGPWQFQSKKTGLKQEGQYKYKPVGWSGEGEPPKPLPPKWKGLSWVGKGLPHADAPAEAPPVQSSTST
ncbi:hypothetical protein CYMTET_46692 [Cymbomonas tetramitiformis]|uniref:TerD domain-containing protein n=1 Tax=Cymbomonas tetramitiformis TaxID=36881 RepID=A0AAE0EXD0_9CHLO|nr:hypothetical protein CYMTET_46692 [Cymbomonas tetramitiformis]